MDNDDLPPPPPPPVDSGEEHDTESLDRGDAELELYAAAMFERERKVNEKFAEDTALLSLPVTIVDLFTGRQHERADDALKLFPFSTLDGLTTAALSYVSKREKDLVPRRPDGRPASYEIEVRPGPDVRFKDPLSTELRALGIVDGRRMYVCLVPWEDAAEPPRKRRRLCLDLS
jgi:hypothetical protein